MVVIGQFSSPEEAAEQGLVYSDRFKTLRLFQDIFSDWEPSWQAFPINHAMEIAGLAGCIPGAIIAIRLRRILPGLTRARVRWIPIPLSVFVPGALSVMFHEELITKDILLQETPCSVCVETRAICGQVGLGVGLSFGSAFAGSVIIGNFLSLKWVPRSFGGLLWLTKDVISKSSLLLVTLTAAEMVVAGGLVYFQQSAYDSVMEELERRVAEDKREVIDGRIFGMQRD
eukprot:GFUD01038683.1.p1 GENE.GFUD01038683.1~~GFUD01038683.1.p1  ORF type:complete len:229 (+),score=34.82 GFUD01038683.1:59-745(+)